MAAWKQVITPAEFTYFSNKYHMETGFGAILVSGSKIPLNHCTYYPWETAHKQNINLSQMIHESLRWGEPNINLDSMGIYLWCVPICLNNRSAGGIFSAAHPDKRDTEHGELISRSAWKLLELGCKQNICNASLMRLRREHNRTNTEKAEAIHTVKQNLFRNPREIYLQEEYGLLAAIRKGSKEKARQIINRILLRIYSLGKGDLDILKALVLEMVVLMYRAAVDKGADPRELLGVNSSYLKTFNEIKDDIALSNWLRRWLEALINTNSLHLVHSQPDSISLAIEYMKNNLQEPITRDETAKYCNMSFAYFSKIFKHKTGFTFTDLLNKFRIEKACALLDETSLNISEIAFQTGFNDPSYFNKVFRKYRQITPKQYKKT